MQEESASHSSPRRGGWRGDIACGIALGGAYFAAAMLGLRLASLHASASPVWPPTGIALAALLALGTRMWPAITLGALVANVLVSGSWPVSAGIALGNTLEALIGAGLIRRYARGPQVFEHATDIFRFVGFGALLCTATSATVGVTSLCLGGLASWGDFWSIWITWWLGDAVGALVVAPPLVLWSRRPWPRWCRWSRLHATLLLFLTVTTTVIVFNGALLGLQNLPLSFLCIPPLVWAAFRFEQHGAATTSLLISAVAVWCTAHGFGPFVAGTPNSSLLLLQAFMGTVAVTALALGAVVAERRRVMEALLRAHDTLEERIAARTAELSVAVTSLHEEIEDRAVTEAKLSESERNLAAAQALAHVGSWSWEIPSNRVHWSDELYRVFGIVPEGQPLTYEFFLERVHAADRAFVDATVRGAASTGKPFEFEHRIILPDTSIRWIHALGEVSMRSGVAASMHGTVRDITEHKHNAAERRRLELELLEVGQREQLRLGQDLHDDLGQLLTGVAFLAKTLEKKLAALASDDARAMFEIRSLVDVAIGKTRDLARGLPAASIFGEGLSHALRELASTTERLFDVSCVVESDESDWSGNPQIAMHLYRIAQEATSNAIRHGQAKHIVIGLAAGGPGITLSVRDDGVGFSPDAGHGGLGLRIMRYRADLLGARIEISSAPAATIVTCAVLPG